MATKDKEAPVEESKAVTVAGGVNLPADLLAEAAEYAGQGTSSASEDNLVPFVSVLQDMSPQVKRRDPAYVEGAEPGKLLVKAINLLADGEEGLIVQPCYFEKVVVEWIPRDSGGGFVARHKTMPPDAKEIPNPRNPERTIWVRPNGNELIETRYHFVNLMLGDGMILPAVISCSSTFHQSSRQWMMAMNMARIPGSPKPVPSWFKTYRMKTQARKNTQGEWFVPVFEEHDWVADASVRALGKNLHDSVASGAMQAGAEEDAAGGGHADSDIPV